jgi:protein-tyrosine-phosphatase
MTLQNNLRAMDEASLESGAYTTRGIADMARAAASALDALTAERDTLVVLRDDALEMYEQERRKRVDAEQYGADYLIAMRERSAQLATALQQCAKGAAEVDTKAKAAKAWEDLYNERNRLWRAAGDKLDAIGSLLERNGCDCDCEHHWEEHGDECDLCLACQISAAVGSWDRRTNDRNP